MNKSVKTNLSQQVYKQLLVKKNLTSYEIAKQTGIDKAYLSKLAGGAIKKPGQDKLIKIARVLNIELKQLQKIFIQPEAAALELNLGAIDLAKPETKINPRQDWGNAPNGLVCYGREAEIATLKQWMIEDSDRIITLYGLSGIGKTTLAIELVQQLQKEFDYVFWRSLHSAPPIETIISEILKLFEVQSQAEFSYQEQMSLLFSRLRTFRCLLIFDDVEFILATDNSQQEYQLYSEFLRQIAESQHKSCLLLVSNEKLREMSIRECASAAVHSLQVKGSDTIAKNILRDKELPEEDRWNDLIEAYRAHPLALKIVATAIKEVFNGSISEFLQQNTLFLGDLAFILYQEYQRLSDLEKKVICMIADTEQPIPITQIQKQFNHKIRNSDVMWSLDTLIRRSLVEANRVQGITLYFLHPVVKKYLNTQC